MDDLPQDCVDIFDTIYGNFVVVPEVEIVWDRVGFPRWICFGGLHTVFY